MLRREFMSGRLPAEYQEVEYLESTGTQWIDSGYLLDSYTCVEFKMFFTGKTAPYSPYFGSMSNNKIYMALWNNTNQNTTTFGLYTSYHKWTEYVYYMPVQDNTMVIYSQSRNISNATFTHQLNNYTATHSCFYDDEIGEKTITIMTYNSVNENPGNRLTKGKWYYFKIYKRNDEQQVELSRDFLPCYRISDTKPGMYDLVTNTFFTNQGSGEFLYGPEVY